MIEQMGHNWWAFATRGIVAAIVGILVAVWPGMTIAALVLRFGAYALVDGAFAVVAAIAHATAEHRRALLFEGMVGLLVGFVALVQPDMTALSLVFLIAGWGVVTGLLEILTAIRLRREMSGELLLIQSGIASVAFGLLFASLAGAGPLAIAVLTAAYVELHGWLLFALAYRLRSAVRTGRAVGRA